MKVFFRCLAEAVLAKGVRGLMDLVPGGGFIYDVAEDTLERLRHKQRDDEIRREMESLANAGRPEVQKAAAEVVAELPVPPEHALALVAYLTGVPAAVRQSLKRPDDPSGCSVPTRHTLRNSDDVVAILPPRAPQFAPGQTPPALHGWILEDLLGTGGFGEVWKVRHPRLANLVGACKFAHNLTDRERSLLHEGDVISRVMAEGRHPGIVPLQDAYLENTDTPWLRFELVRGGDLCDEIRSWQALDVPRRQAKAVLCLRLLAETVGHFHRLDVPLVHRDLKPSNVLLDRPSKPRPGDALGFVPRVGDFGISGVAAKRRLDGESRGQSRGGRLLSYLRGSYTPLYASPQQRDGNDPDPRDDVHALGVIGCQMLTGQLHQGAGPDTAEELQEMGVSEALIRVLSRCIAGRAEKRYQGGGELAERLAELGQKPDVSKSVPVQAPQPVQPPAPPPDDDVKRDYAELVSQLLRGGHKCWLHDTAPTRLPRWRAAAQTKLIEAVLLAAECAETGAGMILDYAEALRLYHSCADHPYAQLSIGNITEAGHGVTTNLSEAMKWYVKAADQNFAPAQACIGNLYRDGRGVQKDYAEAMGWYRLAAAQGHLDAQNNVGALYERAYEDPANALKWYKKAAEDGHSGAMNNLGDLYHFGRGVARNYREALKWFTHAADLGDVEGQYNVAVHLRDGLGVKADHPAALKWCLLAANKGHAAAANDVGWLYANGDGVARDHAEALEWYHKAADLGSRSAMTNLGLVYRDGQGVKKDLAEALHWFRVAADKGHASAQFHLGRAHSDGDGVPKDEAEALKWFRLAAEQGHAAAQYAAGESYYHGWGVSRDYGEAVRWYRKSAEQGHAEAQASLGLLCRHGFGLTSPDLGEAVKWYRAAAEQNHAGAQVALGAIYSQGAPGAPRNFAEAARWFRKAAEQGNHVAQEMLAGMYHRGDGVEQDFAEAMKWYRQAVALGMPAALHGIGCLHRDGLGVPANHPEAMKWFRQAADKGHAQAQADVGWLFEKGLGTVRDLSQAAAWYGKAAEMGNAEGQYNFARLLEFGHGVPRDREAALGWYRKAAAAGHGAAVEAIKALGMK